MLETKSERLEPFDSNVWVKTFQQYHNGFPIEGASFQTFTNDSGYILFTSGYIIENLDIEPIINLTQNDAIQTIKDSLETLYPEIEYAWENDSLEYWLGFDSLDFTTYYPNPILNYVVVSDNIDSLDVKDYEFRLCYVFDISFTNILDSIGDELYVNSVRCYVDVETGEIININELTNHFTSNFTHYMYGNQIFNIETLYKSSKYHLWSPSTPNGKDIVTSRHYSQFYYGVVEHTSSTWGFHRWDATAVHWAAENAWDFLQNEFLFRGLDGHGKRYRIYANAGSDRLAYDKKKNLILIGNYNGLFSGAVDMIGHEICHGIAQHVIGNSSNPYPTGFDSQTKHNGGNSEPNNISEAYSDIFGTVLEHYVFGYNNPPLSNWTLGEHVTTPMRSMENPSSINSDLGFPHPHIYKGDNWHYAATNKPHHNSTAFSHMFYLLSEGGTPTETNITVTGIGIEKAFTIAAMAFKMMHTWESFHQARDRFVLAARLKYGLCSFEYYETCKAFAAINVEEPCQCPPIAEKVCWGWDVNHSDFVVLNNDQNKNNKKSRLYPVPAQNTILFEYQQDYVCEIQIKTIDGKVLKTIFSDEKGFVEINIKDLSSGIYILVAKSQIGIETFKFIKE